MTMATHTDPAIQAYCDLGGYLDRKVPADLGEAVDLLFTREMDEPRQFDALVRAFDTLVRDVENKGINNWSTALLKAVARMAETFMNSNPTFEHHILIGSRIEDAARAGLRGRRTDSRYVPYTCEELLCVLIAKAAEPHYDSQLETCRRDAVSIAGKDLTGFRSIVEYHH